MHPLKQGISADATLGGTIPPEQFKDWGGCIHPTNCAAAPRRPGAYARLTIGVEQRRRGQQRRREMLLATTTVEDFDRFVKIFSTKGAEKRKQHGSKGSRVFRDPNQDDRVWVLFDWDEEGWQNFVSDPEVPAIIQEAGHKSKPQAAVFGGQYDA
jgi:hypothetical protein